MGTEGASEEDAPCDPTRSALFLDKAAIDWAD